MRDLRWGVALAAVTAGCSAGAGHQPAEAVGSSTQAICSSGGLSSGVPSNYAAPGTLVTFTATAGCDAGDTPTYEFWSQPPGGSWSTVQDWSTSNTYNWDTTGDATGTYNFEVWIRAQGSMSIYETWSGQPFVLGNVTECSSVSSATTPSGQTTVGDTVTISSSASCGSSAPQYEIWYDPPGGVFTLLQAYGPSATYNWDTSTAVPGTYEFQVWALAEGSTNTYDSFYGFYYSLGTACSGVTLTFDPVGQSIAGTPIAVNASGTCGGTATYQFWQNPPGGSWTMVQDWSTNATYNWDTSTAAAGDYAFQVWTRNKGSTAIWEAWTGEYYTLTSSSPCTSGAISPSLPSPQSLATPVTFTASASGCASAQYQFWAEAPGGPWTMVQDWSSTATYSPSPTVTGMYGYQVWIRQTGSTGQYDTWAGLSYQFE